MALTFYPKAGTILACDFTTGFKEPEMVKHRPVVVVSVNHMHYPELYTVVPISGTGPRIVRNYHYLFEPNPIPHSDEREAWAKCDMVVTVARHRLDRLSVRRKYFIIKIKDEELLAIRKCLKHVLGIDG